MGILTVLTHKVILSAFLSYFLASFIKVFFHYMAYDQWNLLVFFRTGGMPSAHTATVAAMTTSIYLMEGASDLFFVCIVMSSIIISDAVGIRRSAGKQAYVINKMIDEFRYFRKFKTKRLQEFLGHTPKQVFAGLILGIAVARILFWF